MTQKSDGNQQATKSSQPPSPSSGTFESPKNDAPKNEAVTALKDGLTAGAQDFSKEVQHIATDVAGEAKKAAETKLDAGRDFAAEQLGSVAGALRHTSEHLRSEDSGLSDYVEKAATSIESVSRYMQTRTLSQLIGDVEGYARREPALFLGGAFVLGLVGGRFLKSATPAPTRNGGTDHRGGPAFETRLGGWPQLNPRNGGNKPTDQASSKRTDNGSGAG